MTTKSAHTPEPWRLEKGRWANEGRTFIKSDRNGMFKPFAAETTYAVAEDSHGSNKCHDAAEANARRIVACVNACAGISTEALESGIVADMLAALNEYTTAVCAIAMENPTMTVGQLENYLHRRGTPARALAAIAKAKAEVVES